ncbi:MAG: SIS domain-containing protein [Spirochaetia bacterium]
MWQDLIKNKEDMRYVHTLREISQQPQAWRETFELVAENQALKAFLQKALANEHARIIISGAGSSEFVGLSAIDTMTEVFGRTVMSAPTTDIVTNPKKYSIPTPAALMISYGRSGNSPESVASYELMKQVAPETKHLVITCNKEGNLALRALDDPDTFALILPKQTNDQSLVMTSSYSSMVLASVLCAQLFAGGCDRKLLDAGCAFAREWISEKSEALYTAIAPNNVRRVQYLGTSDARGVLTEGHLKMLEMTDGQVATRVDSFLGLRHGPQVFVDKNTLVCAVLSEDSYIRQYELDLLAEMQQKQQGAAYIIVGEGASQLKLPHLVAIETGGLGDFFRVLPAIIVVQLLGLYKSLAVGLSPDAPSASGTINRVVQGVNIYPYKKL